MTIVPPHAACPSYPRDLIVLIDTSGSMAGRPLERAQQVLGLAIEALGGDDQLELIAFSSQPLHFQPQPVRATREAKQAALAWLHALTARGGTEMQTAVQRALRSLREGAQRQVVIATDGYIANEAAIVRDLHAGLPRSCRLHFLGIGSSVNRSLATAMARAGRGAEVLCDLDGDPERAARRLIDRTRSPVITGLRFAGSAVIASAPEHLPDVFAASPVVAAVQLRAGQLIVRGQTPAGDWERRLRVELPPPGEGNPAIAALYGREHVADLESRAHGGEDHDAAIERAGLAFQIATRRTPLVAIDEDRAIAPATRTVIVPQELPYGTTAAAFGLDPAAGSTVGAAGHNRVRAAAPRGELGPQTAQRCDAPSGVIAHVPPQRTQRTTATGAPRAGIAVAETTTPAKPPIAMAAAKPASASGRMPPRGTPQHLPLHGALPPAPPVQRTRLPSSTPPGALGRSRDPSWDRLASARRVDTGGTTAVQPASAAPRPGNRVDHYELIKLIGEGGTSSVFLARDLQLGRRVAIKFLHSRQPALAQRFLDEARTTARCQHDNIVVVYDVGEHDGAPYLVLEHLSGTPLTDLLEDGKRLPYARAIEIMRSILRALSCAHDQGIVHCDLKPDNIFLTDAGTIKVLDFGVARMLQPRAELGGDTPHDAAMATPRYMSPEQWGIGIAIDHLSDLWACGVLLYQMIGGRHPLHPLDGNQLMVTALLDVAMPSLAGTAPAGVPRALIEIVDRCLRKPKDQRWPSAAELLAALDRVLPSPQRAAERVDDNPYAGLASFQEADAGKFFGRNREIAAMISRIRDRPVMAVVGASGVGKSSFVRAGLVPALLCSGEPWDVLIVRPGCKPLEALAGVVAPMARAASLADEVEEQHERVARLGREPGYLGSVLRGCARRDGRRVLLFVDQFEELYTLVRDASERAAFTACLAAAGDDATSPVRVVLSIRSDFLGRVAEDERLAGELAQGVFFLAPPGRDGLREAIIRPAELAGFRFELSAVVENMLDHLDATPGALPLLQFAAARLWETRDVARRLLTARSYAAIGGVAGALAGHADRVVADLGADRAPLVRALLLRLVTAQRTCAIVPRAELRTLAHDSGAVQDVIDRLVDARLLVVQPLDDGRSSAVEIIHESLIRGWPTLRRWLDEDHDDAQLVDQLRIAARQWLLKRFDTGLLWRGEAAADARKLHARYRGPLSELERGFLEAVVRHEAAQVRHRRAAIALGLLALAGTAVVALALLGILDASRTAARANEAQAIAQTRLADDRLDAIERAEAARRAAETETKKAVHKTQIVTAQKEELSGELARSKEDLIVERDHANIATAAAEHARRIAEDQERRARRSEAEAVTASGAATESNGRLQQALDKECKRIIQLEDSIGSKPIPAPLKPFDPDRAARSR